MKFFIHLGVHLGVKTTFFCQWIELLSFLCCSFSFKGCNIPTTVDPSEVVDGQDARKWWAVAYASILCVLCWVKGNRLFKRLFFCENQIMIHMVDSQLFAQSVVLNSTIWKTSAKIEKLWCLNRIIINVSNNFLFFVSCETVTLPLGCLLFWVNHASTSWMQLCEGMIDFQSANKIWAHVSFNNARPFDSMN